MVSIGEKVLEAGIELSQISSTKKSISNQWLVTEPLILTQTL